MVDASKEERAVVLAEWPQPAAGAPQPRVLANDKSLSVCYRTDKQQFAIIRFPLCTYLTFGAPNDEALSGHPLTKCGLTFYSVHEVYNSSLIHLLERRNSVHPRHNQVVFLKNSKHYIFTFHDSTLECVINVGEFWKPTIEIFEEEEEAERFWQASLRG